MFALANVAPARASEIYRLERDGRTEAARGLNAALAELNRPVTVEYGVADVKAALEARGQPAGDPRRPLQPLADDDRSTLEAVLAEVLEMTAAP